MAVKSSEEMLAVMAVCTSPSSLTQTETFRPSNPAYADTTNPRQAAVASNDTNSVYLFFGHSEYTKNEERKLKASFPTIIIQNGDFTGASIEGDTSV